MELRTFWRTLLRRWYLTLAVIVLTCAATFLVVGRVGPTYETAGSTLVFPPTQSTWNGGSVKTEGNPLIGLAGVTQARDVVIRSLTSKTVRDEWEEEHPGMSYDATPDFTNSAPIILFTVQGDTAQGSVKALESLMDRVPGILGDLQSDLRLDANGLVTSQPITRDTESTLVQKTQIRAGILAAAVTGCVGLLLIALLDALLAMRARGAAQPAVAPAAKSRPARKKPSQETERRPVARVGRAEAAGEPSREPSGKSSVDPPEPRGLSAVQDARPRTKARGGRG